MTKFHHHKHEKLLGFILIPEKICNDFNYIKKYRKCKTRVCESRIPSMLGVHEML